jgi:hypothetical protein
MKMETRIISLLTILALNFSISFAKTNVTFTEVRPAESSIINLAPVSPAEAEFSDLEPEACASAWVLVPVTPKEATFDEEYYPESTDEESLLRSLSPSTPKEAGFEENV